MARGAAKRAAASEPVEGPWPLPEGWRWERLGRYVSEGGASVNPAHSPDTEFQLYSVPSHPTGRPEIVIGRSVGSAKQVVHPDDVLLCKINPRINRVWKVKDFETGPLIASTEWIRFVHGEEVEPDYLRYFLMRDKVRDYLAMNASGVGGSLMRVRPATVEPIPFPVPKREVQRRIVARIDALFAEVEEGEAALRRARSDLATWRKSLLKAAVTGELTADWRAAHPPGREGAETGADLLARILADRRTRWQADPRNKGRRYIEPTAPDTSGLPELPDGWVWASLEQLIDRLRNGLSVKPGNAPPGVPILRISAVREMAVSQTDRRWLPPNFDVGEALAATGDLLFTRYNGSPELVGVCGRHRGSDLIAYPDKIMCARPSSMLPTLGDYLELAMNAGSARAFIKAFTKTSAGQHGVSGETVKRAPVPMPPTAEVAQIVQCFHALSAEAAEGWDRASLLSEAAATLRQSILSAAFRGELAG